MSKFKSEFMQIMEERGFLYQCTDKDGLDALFQQGPVTAYIGFDCTAPSLHVGSLIQIMVLRWLQKTENKPIVLIGGATTKVGDPSGKDESRPVITDEKIVENTNGIKKIFSQFELGDVQFVNNKDWITPLPLMEMLRLGRLFSVNNMLTLESVKLRLDREQHLSLTEFIYLVIQAYDFVELRKKYGCLLQIGGSDQWGNIVNGVELWRKLCNEEGNVGSGDIFGLTTPLITTSSGAKMGKTAEGAVWLNPDMLAPYDYWQFWRNTSDADVGRFLRLFTELPLPEIKKLEKLKDAEINEAKIILANEATRICHGEEAAKKAAETAKQTFEKGGTGDDLPVVEKKRTEIEKGLPYVELFVEARLADSKGAVRRLIAGGGVKVNGNKISEIELKTSGADLDKSGVIKLSIGKKKHAIVKAV